MMCNEHKIVVFYIRILYVRIQNKIMLYFTPYVLFLYENSGNKLLTT